MDKTVSRQSIRLERVRNDPNAGVLPCLKGFPFEPIWPFVAEIEVSIGVAFSNAKGKFPDKLLKGLFFAFVLRVFKI